MRSSTMFRSLSAVTVLCLLGAFNQAVAQDDTTQYVVAIIQLKPDMVDEWRELQESEIVPALRQAGVPTRTVLETLFGDRPEFVTIRPLDSFAEYDGPGILQTTLGEREAESIIARLQTYEVSTQRIIVDRENEFDVGDTTAPVRITTWYKVNPGAAPLYRAFLREEVIPALQQAADRDLIAGYTVSTLGFGAPEAGIWSQSLYRTNVGSLDSGNPVTEILGAAGAQALAARANQLRTTVRTTVRRIVPELSY
jgi:hypothetical protein